MAVMRGYDVPLLSVVLIMEDVPRTAMRCQKVWYVLVLMGSSWQVTTLPVVILMSVRI